MKRIIISILLLVIPLSLVPAVSYSPAVTLTTGFRAAHLREDILRTSAAVGFETEIPAISWKHHRLSLPLGFTGSTKTKDFQGLSLHGYMEGTVGLSYDYQIDDNFTVGADLKCIYRYYEEIDSALAGGAFDLVFIYTPTRNIGIILPFEMSFLKGEIDYNLSVGTRIIFGGGR